MKKAKHLALSAAICMVVTLGTVLLIRGFSYFIDIYEDFRGYDYDSKIAKQYDWIGPGPGEIIDPNRMVNAEGTSFNQLPKNELIVLTVVEPECAASRESEEQMRFLEENLTDKGVDYFLACFSRKTSRAALSEYVNSLNLHTESLSWTDDFENVLPSIKAIVYPSHILVNRNGTVIKTFPGTSNDRSIRDRMVRQVLKEVIAYRDRRSNEVGTPNR